METPVLASEMVESDRGKRRGGVRLLDEEDVEKFFLVRRPNGDLFKIIIEYECKRLFRVGY